jgi:transposase
MPATAHTAIAVVGIDIGKNSFHIVGLDDRGAIVLRQKWSRNQVEARFANLPPCLIGMEACVGARCAADAGEVRAPLFQRPKERLP